MRGRVEKKKLEERGKIKTKTCKLNTAYTVSIILSKFYK